MQISELESALRVIYGDRAPQIFHAVMPGILADFSRMIAQAGPNAVVREEYNLEDRKGTIVLSCRKSAGRPGPIDAVCSRVL